MPDVGDGRRPEVGEGVGFEAGQHAGFRGRCPAGVLVVKPGQGSTLESPLGFEHGLQLVGFAFGTWVLTFGQRLTGIVAAITGRLQRGVWVGAQGQSLLFAAEAVFQEPISRYRPAASTRRSGLGAGLAFLAAVSVKDMRATPNGGNFLPQCCPQLPPDVREPQWTATDKKKARHL